MNNGAPYLDFNDAGGQQEFSSVAEQHHEKEEIKARLQSQIESVLYHLLPAGKVRHGQFFIGDVEGNPGESMKVELTGEKAGVWYDHAAGSGGDILDLWARSRGMDTRTQFRDVMDDVRGWLGESVRLPPVSMQPTQRREPPMDELGPHTGKWDYFDTNGQLLVCVYRYDPPGRRKQFRPLDVRTGKWQSPAVTPLYNLPGIIHAAEVVLVEGEKSAQALIDAGIPATTSMGSKGQINRADWSVLQGKRVIIWPDRDKAGWEYAQLASQAARNAGVREVSILTPPEEKPEKWDAADAMAEGMDVRAFIHGTPRQEPQTRKRRIRLMDWTFDRYDGPPPPREWLVEGVLPLGVPGMVAAIGGAGKSMLLLDLCIKVAQIHTGNPIPTEALGGPLVPIEGTAVMLTAEDDQDEIHRRLNLLVGDLPDPRRLIVIPLPNAGGAMPLVAMGREGPVLTDAYEEMRQELLEIPDLRLVVIDPLQSFAGGDVNSDPAAGSMFFAGLGRIAAETGATTLVAHHFKKVGSKPIHSASEAREAIRGTTALVDGGRWSYALWEASQDESIKICTQLQRSYERDSVFNGAVVKSNWPVDKAVRVYVRESSTGLLQDRSVDLAMRISGNEDLSKSLVMALGKAASNGQPFTKTGGNGVFERRSELPGDLQAFSKHKIAELIDSLLRTGRLVQCVAPGSHIKKWLDVPGGEFALGVGEFQLGSGAE
ncbi:plasmid and phage DNA primase / plasmid and phage replicative helicase [Magnetococcus marinus MC-1]|uniref:Plasmid and phage DNA primase / plasmid and phage replicative helicase n=1 Tax=Magnetococcus marinus (strain ATCC BAA-1437 / JCM 17883 / MC-1) TaxID=156889 RepID=A0L707_MAGMM|nr:AAA family ATPase [Magnetococcus marinus]ABK43750.1 plasmid and phage DNA primase / plasmid and phage replicative helicase [Magnetococcus marinus MC-1]